MRGSMVWTPAPGMAKSIVTVRPVARLASRIAWRSEPGPLSAVVSTTKTPSVITNCASEWRRAVGLGTERRGWQRRAVPPAGVKIRPSSAAFERRQRTAVRQRSGPIARAGQAGGTRQRQRPVGDRERQVPDRVERPGIGVLDRDPVARLGRESQRLVRPPREAISDGACRVALTKGRDFRGVALGVGGRGRDDRQPGRRA